MEGKPSLMEKNNRTTFSAADYQFMNAMMDSNKKDAEETPDPKKDDSPMNHSNPDMDIEIPCVYDPNQTKKLNITEALETCLDHLITDLQSHHLTPQLPSSFGIPIFVIGARRVRFLEIIYESLFLNSEAINKKIIESKILDNAMDLFFLSPTNNIYHNVYSQLITKILTDKTSSMYRHIMQSEYIGKFVTRLYETIKQILGIHRETPSCRNENPEIDLGFGSGEGSDAGVNLGDGDGEGEGKEEEEGTEMVGGVELEGGEGTGKRETWDFENQKVEENGIVGSGTDAGSTTVENLPVEDEGAGKTLEDWD